MISFVRALEVMGIVFTVEVVGLDVNRFMVVAVV